MNKWDKDKIRRKPREMGKKTKRDLFESEFDLFENNGRVTLPIDATARCLTRKQLLIVLAVSLFVAALVGRK